MTCKTDWPVTTKAKLNQQLRGNYCDSASGWVSEGNESDQLRRQGAIPHETPA